MKNLALKSYSFIILFFSIFYLTAQEELPKGLTETERELLPQFQFNSRLVISDPPEGPVRAAAEWEEVEYLVVRWTNAYQNILRQIVEVGVQECKVLITTQNESSVTNYLTNQGVDLTNVEFLNTGSNSIWIRDYGGNTIYSDDVGERALTDWIYNRPRPLDDVMPTQHANMIGMPIYVTDTGINDLVNTGGNYMSDGLGNAFASNLILEENEPGNPYNVSAKTEEEIDAIMNAYMGIENYIKMETLPYDEIHHIDMHMKLLDEETILVSKYPEGVADGPQIEENIDYVLSNFQSPFGTPYEIKWIDAPPSTSGSYPDTGGYYRTYSNAVFVNKSVIVPTYRPEVDEPALDYLRELLPGYNVVGIDVDNSNEPLIASLGAIHCITHTIGVDEPLWIVHQPINEVPTGNTNVSITAMIKHVSGINNATVYWREEGESEFNQLSMTIINDDNWSADLMIPSGSESIEYYIEAEANSGKSLARPLVAPEGFWTFTVANLSNEEWADNNISAPYPNPTSEVVSFKLNQIEGAVEVSIYNIFGQKLNTTTIVEANGILTLDLNKEWEGMLLVTFEGDFGKVTKKIIKL
ncbi:agmatine deiminase family protein [Flavobacteriaceae bacterium]|nr:agmatine deiminase family protein [Flavobacteriaceae bacterium]MDB4590742.1 agmatine deiminase family protein [Flavobacteriaceae bacterium]MDC6467446.1 agmatine deiminase family protein [Flavobacteriaceae bacterium]